MRIAATLIAPIVLIGAVASIARADDQHSVAAIAAVGKSLTSDRRVDNLAPPSVELRYGYRLPAQPLVRLEAGLAIVVFPEHIPELRLGARAHVLQPLTMAPVARDLFIGAHLQTLVSIDGFDLAPNLEVGLAVERSRLVGVLAIGVSRYLRGPRLVTEARVGVGFTF